MSIEKYKSIIDHEHHTSEKHPRMSSLKRAAQFAPFAALTGYEDVIAEAGRAVADDGKECDNFSLTLGNSGQTSNEI